MHLYTELKVLTERSSHKKRSPLRRKRSVGRLAVASVERAGRACVHLSATTRAGRFGAPERARIFVCDSVRVRGARRGVVVFSLSDNPRHRYQLDSRVRGAGQLDPRFRRPPPSQRQRNTRERAGTHSQAPRAGLQPVPHSPGSSPKSPPGAGARNRSGTTNSDSRSCVTSPRIPVHGRRPPEWTLAFIAVPREWTPPNSGTGRSLGR